MKQKIIKFITLLLVVIFLTSCGAVETTTILPSESNPSREEKSTVTETTNVILLSSDINPEDYEAGIVEIDGRLYLNTKRNLDDIDGSSQINQWANPLVFSTIEEMQTWLDQYDSSAVHLDIKSQWLDSIMRLRKQTMFLLPDFEKITFNHPVYGQNYTAVWWDPGNYIAFRYPESDLCIFYSGDPVSKLNGYLQEQVQSTYGQSDFSEKVTTDNFMDISLYPQTAEKMDLFGHSVISVTWDNGRDDEQYQYFRYNSYSYEINDDQYYLLIQVEKNRLWEGSDCKVYTIHDGYLYQFSKIGRDTEDLENIPEIEFYFDFKVD